MTFRCYCRVVGASKVRVRLCAQPQFCQTPPLSRHASTALPAIPSLSDLPMFQSKRAAEIRGLPLALHQFVSRKIRYGECATRNSARSCRLQENCSLRMRPRVRFTPIFRRGKIRCHSIESIGKYGFVESYVPQIGVDNSARSKSACPNFTA